MTLKFNLFTLGIGICMGSSALAQDYSTYSQFNQRVTSLAAANSSMVNIQSLTKTTGGKDIWMITIGTGNTGQKPGIAIVGGVEGSHLLGAELALGFAEKLVKGAATDSIRALLAKTTFYVFPNMSPDAGEQYFAKLRYARNGNARSTDDDRDGKVNEDGFEDLDGDGRITWMRVEDPTGKYRVNPEDPRSLVLANPAKGETGKYLLFSEGIDNDKDGQFNEDGEGGIQFNKNMSFNYPNFQPGAGEFAVSENENRALLDRLFELSNVFAVVTFGPNNNLSAPVVFSPAGISKRIITGYFEPDTKINALVSDVYNKQTGSRDAPKTSPGGGDFSQWAYFHYGRFSFSTPGWWVPKSKPDTTAKEKPLLIEDAVPNYLRWAKSQGITGTYKEWTKINHPDFPGKVVEVGGIDPFALINPPYKLVDGLVTKHTGFLVALAKMAPQLDIVNIETEKAGDNLTRITLTVMNKGAIASQTKVGERSYWVKKIAVKVITTNSQNVVSGRKNQVLDAIEGYGNQTLSWLVQGSGNLSIEAGSPTTGSKKIEITLK
ncbi:M14 family metallopeptidase [Hufsiella ginkgonis]|uniref:Peptidase n=1 Tax=Hufsiella ginkgonis TaxID=2695274 RepID=A0A7K1Y5K1_9SPHI|nr:M14 family metallopeptidase [Hufsiella ginkgonis]MXV17986.1 peptidase [Hufsiella ginkgonis]